MYKSTNPFQALEDKALFPHQMKNPDFYHAYQQFYYDRASFYVPHTNGGDRKLIPCFEEPKSFFLVHTHPHILEENDLIGSSIFGVIFVQYLYTNPRGDFVCRHHHFQDFSLASSIRKEQELELAPKTFADSVAEHGDIRTYKEGEELFNPNVVFKLQPEDYHYFADFFSGFPQFREQLFPFVSTKSPTHFL